MLRTVLTRTLAERTRGALMFAVAATAVTAMYVGVFPSFESEMAGYADALPEAMRAFMGDDFASPAGYLQSTIFTILGPVIMVSAAASWGASAIAGEEERRTLAVVLSAPLSRTRIAVEKAVGVAIVLTLLAAVMFAALALWVTTFGVDVPIARVGAAMVHLHALACLAGGLAFGVGAAWGRRSLALGAALGVVVLGFAISGISGMVDGAEQLHWVSPFYWFNGSEPVRNGIHTLSLALLYGGVLLATALGIARFSRRDLH